MDVHRNEDEMVVSVAEDVRTAGLAAVELPLAVKPTQAGTEAAMAMVGGIEELSRVTADEVRGLLVSALLPVLMVVDFKFVDVVYPCTEPVVHTGVRWLPNPQPKPLAILNLVPTHGDGNDKFMLLIGMIYSYSCCCVWFRSSVAFLLCSAKGSYCCY